MSFYDQGCQAALDKYAGIVDGAISAAKGLRGRLPVMGDAGKSTLRGALQGAAPGAIVGNTAGDGSFGDTLKGALGGAALGAVGGRGAHALRKRVGGEYAASRAFGPARPSGRSVSKSEFDRLMGEAGMA